MMQSFSGSDVLKAEILWTLKSMDSHFSYNSFTNVGMVFKTMFPDSAIASQFARGERKAAYISTFGIAPYLQEELSK